MQLSRAVGFAAVWASAVEAGIIASSKGRAIMPPTPRSMVRRDRCFLVMNIGCLLNLPTLCLPGYSRFTLRLFLPGTITALLTEPLLKAPGYLALRRLLVPIPSAARWHCHPVPP